MSYGANVIYVYDGSFDGLMCCVAEAKYRAERPESIVPEEEKQESLFEPRYVETVSERAESVKKEIRAKISNNALHFVKKSFLTALEDKEIRIFDFIEDGFRRGYVSMNDIAGNKMNSLYNAVRALDNEAELLRGFVRFSDMGGVLVSVIEPKNYVLPLLMGHFCSRFHDEALLIYDKTHHMVLLGQNGRGKIAYLDEFDPGEADSTEREMRKMWKHFYDTIAIKERYNPRCRMGHMPKRYWAYMTEMQSYDEKEDKRLEGGNRLAIEA